MKKSSHKKFTTIPMLIVFAIAVCLFSSYAFRKNKTIKKDIAAPTITLAVQQVADNLQAPTSIAFPGNGEVWIAEQTGKVRVLKTEN